MMDLLRLLLRFVGQRKACSNINHRYGFSGLN